MDATIRIKNLSIALEALSRIVGAHEHSAAIDILLQEEIRAFREEKEKETQWPGKPARTSTTNTDDIPF